MNVTAATAAPSLVDRVAEFEAEDEDSAQRKLKGPLGHIARAIAIALPVLTLWWAFSGWWDSMTRAAAHLMLAVPLVFLYYPSTPRRQNVTWIDFALAALSTIAFGWIVISQDRLMWRLVYVDPLTWPDLALGIVAIAVVLEATRRIIGWSLIVTTALFLVYAIGGPLMPGALQHQGVPISLLIDHLYLVPEGLFNVITGIMATYLLMFLAFANLLRLGGGTRIIMDVATVLGSRMTGGPAKVAVLGSALMGMVSGSTSANAITMGTITIPLMKQNGFRAIEAAAIETAAGVGGALMPPVMGAGVFIMAELTGIPLVTILTYSVLPAILYFASVFAYVHVKASRRGLTPTASAPALRPLLMAARDGMHLVVPFVLLVAMLVWGYTPFYAASLGVVALIAISYTRPHARLTPRRIAEAFEITTRGALMLSVTSACAAIVMGIITSTGLMSKITVITLALAQNSLFIGIVLVAVIAFILGLGLPVTMSYILVSTLAAPALGDLGATLLASHLVIFWFAQDATITPPLCTTAFVAATIAGSPPMQTGWESFRVAKALYVIPFLLVYSNLLSGNVPLMLFDFCAALLALSLLPVVMEGWLNGALALWTRLALIAAAVAALIACIEPSIVAGLSWLVASLLIVAFVYGIQRRRVVLLGEAL